MQERQRISPVHMAKANELTRTTACREEKLSEPTILEFRFKAVHTSTRQTARGENGYKRLCEGTERRHHFFLHSAHTMKPKDLKRFGKHLRFWEETSILRLWLVLRSVGAFVQDWCIGWPPGRGNAECRLFNHCKRNMGHCWGAFM